MIGSISVLVGLVFVGLELRQNAESVQSQTRSQIATAYADLIASQREDNGLLEALAKTRAGQELTPLEHLKVRLNTAAHLRLAENSFYQYRLGYYSEEEFDAERRFWRSYYSVPLLRVFWEETKEGFSSQFQNELDSIIYASQEVSSKQTQAPYNVQSPPNE